MWRALHNLLTETDEISFEEKVDQFVSKNDKDLSAYLDYLSENYLRSKKQWVICRSKY